MNRSWRSGAHLSLGFASLDRTSPELPPPPCKNMCLSCVKDIFDEYLFFR
ncbi:hypothetical protein HanXRQr2_Chr14g0639871 [Helianthus annuus]|uniref:Uncharacterized protein n=1 Tax=Helianthus annuus TaxID=4232 RepID=A0A9K3EAA7_HELAN|nr:hypothetical protein HanXRQr2_Chr14g0639871 [Helianthus annuus]